MVSQSSPARTRFIAIALLRLTAVVVGEQTGCTDDESFSGVPVNETRLEGCSWIDLDPYDTDHRREVHCDPNKENKQEIRQNCPRACGLCCGDNTRFRFPAVLNGNDISADCNWVGEQLWRQGMYCNIKPADPATDANVEVSCPNACNVCPTVVTPSPVPITDAPSMKPVRPTTTPAPVPAPTVVVSSTSAPTPFVPGTGGAGYGGGSGGGSGHTTPSPTTTTLFFAGDLFSDEKIPSSNSGAIMSGVNDFFAQIDSTTQVHKIFTALKNEGIEGITFMTLDINEGISDFKGLNALCIRSEESTDICNPMVGSFKVDHVPNNRRNRKIRRLEDDNTALIGNLDEIMKNLPGALTAADIDGLNGIFIRNMASDMDSLEDIAVGDIPASSEGNDNMFKKVNVAKIVVPVVVCALLVGFVVMAYVIHRRRQNQIIVELEETMDSVEEENFMSPLRVRNRRTKVVQTEQMKFPVDSGESSNYLPGFDCMCGDPNISTSKD